MQWHGSQKRLGGRGDPLRTTAARAALLSPWGRRSLWTRLGPPALPV